VYIINSVYASREGLGMKGGAPDQFGQGLEWGIHRGAVTDE
jgi:hypothetical protein